MKMNELTKKSNPRLVRIDLQSLPFNHQMEEGYSCQNVWCSIILTLWKLFRDVDPEGRARACV